MRMVLYMNYDEKYMETEHKAVQYLAQVLEVSEAEVRKRIKNEPKFLELLKTLTHIMMAAEI